MTDVADSGPLERATAHLDAINALRADPSITSALSDPSKLVLTSLNSMASTLEAQGIDLAKQIGSQLAGTIMPMIVQTVTDVAGQIPMAGTVFSVFTTIFSGLANMESYNAAAATDACKQLMAEYVIQGSGSNGDPVPADIFYPKVNTGLGPFCSDHGCPLVIATSTYPTTLGMALTLLTEGAPVDANDPDWKALKANGNSWRAQGWGSDAADMWGQDAAYTYDRAKLPNGPSNAAEFERLRVASADRQDEAWKNLHPTNKQVGVSKSRRALYQKLRRAIRSSYVGPNEQNANSDGGVALWTIYLDLLLDDFKKGHFSPPGTFPDGAQVGNSYIGHSIVNRLIPFQPNDPMGGDLLFGRDGLVIDPAASNQTCASIVSNSIVGLIQNWQKTVDPRYLQGQAQMAQLEAQAAAIGRDAAGGVNAALGGGGGGSNPWLVFFGILAVGGGTAFVVKKMGTNA